MTTSYGIIIDHSIAVSKQELWLLHRSEMTFLLNLECLNCIQDHPNFEHANEHREFTWTEMRLKSNLITTIKERRGSRKIFLGRSDQTPALWLKAESPESLSEYNHKDMSEDFVSRDVEASRQESVFSKRHALSSPQRYSGPDRSSLGYNTLDLLCQTKKSDKIIRKVPSGLKTHEFMFHLTALIAGASLYKYFTKAMIILFQCSAAFERLPRWAAPPKQMPGSPHSSWKAKYAGKCVLDFCFSTGRWAEPGMPRWTCQHWTVFTLRVGFESPIQFVYHTGYLSCDHIIPWPVSYGTAL